MTNDDDDAQGSIQYQFCDKIQKSVYVVEETNRIQKNSLKPLSSLFMIRNTDLNFSNTTYGQLFNVYNAN